jgi:hypothetical protein
MATSWLLLVRQPIRLKPPLKYYPTKISANIVVPSKESAFYRIPTELLDEIAEYVGYAYSQLETEEPYARATRGSMGDLCSLSLVSRRFRASAQRLLMRTIPLSDRARLYYISYAQCYCLLRTLIDRPDLARKVQRLKLDVHCDAYLRLGDARNQFKLHVRMD